MSGPAPEPALTLLSTLNQQIGQQQLAALRGEPQTAPDHEALIRQACLSLPFDTPMPALARRINALAHQWSSAQELDRLATEALSASFGTGRTAYVTALYLARQLDRAADSTQPWPQTINAETLRGCWPVLIKEAGPAWISRHTRALSTLTENVARQAEADQQRVSAKHLRLSIPESLATGLPPTSHTPVWAWAYGQAARQWAAAYPLGEQRSGDPLQIGGSELSLAQITPEFVSHQRRSEWWAGAHHVQGQLPGGTYPYARADQPRLMDTVRLFEASTDLRQAPAHSPVHRAQRLTQHLHPTELRVLNYVVQEGARSVMNENGRGDLARWLLLLGSLTSPEQRWVPSDHLWVNPDQIMPGEPGNAEWQLSLCDLTDDLLISARETLQVITEDPTSPEASQAQVMGQRLSSAGWRLAGLLSRELDTGNDTLKAGCDLFAPETVSALKRANAQLRAAESIRRDIASVSTR